MVTTMYHGRTGNNMFQYVFARLIAEHNDLEMVTQWPHQDFCKTTPHAPGRIVEKPVEELRDLYHDEHGQEYFAMNLRHKRIVCNGFFQHPKYYDGNREKILTYFKLQEQLPVDGIVMHVRLTDYADKGLRSVISPFWYLRILQQLKINIKKKRLYIVTDEPGNQYFKHFLQYAPTVVSNGPASDFHFIRRFNTIICSNSSFCWWAAFLSNAEKIITFSRWIREPHGAILRLAYIRRAVPILGNWM